MGRQKFVQYIRMLYLGFIDVNRTVSVRKPIKSKVLNIKITIKSSRFTCETESCTLSIVHPKTELFKFIAITENKSFRLNMPTSPLMNNEWFLSSPYNKTFLKNRPKKRLHGTVVELYREGVTKLFHQMEVNKTCMSFYIWQMK